MRIAILLMLAGLVPMLNGCFPVVATGVGAGVVMAEDRRTSGIFIEDQGIELKSSNRIGEKFKDQVHVNITSFNRTVLLTGEVPDQQAQQEVEALVKQVDNVRRVQNELAVAGNSSYAARANDAYLTSKVKARFLDTKKFQANHVKVVTERGTVYLLGLVKRQEADEATEIARTTGGVQKVVRVFEYLD